MNRNIELIRYRRFGENFLMLESVNAILAEQVIYREWGGLTMPSLIAAHSRRSLLVKADAVPLLDLFEKKMRLEVPLFQRQYVWTLEQQWEPLWEDVSRKFTEFIEGRADGPVHFLGAIVLDQKETPATHVEKRQVIDGQQRLTTLQVFLAVMRDFCRRTGMRRARTGIRKIHAEYRQDGGSRDRSI